MKHIISTMGKTEIHFPYHRVERNRRNYLWKRICCQKIRKGVLWTKNTTFADGWMNGCCTCCMYLPFRPEKSIWFLYKQLKWPDVVSFAQRTPFRIFWQQMRFHKCSPLKKHLKWQELIFFCYCLATLIGLVECPEAERFVCDVVFRLFFILSW